MAQKLGIAVSSYAKIERGETDVNVSRLVQIADVFETNVSDLLAVNGHNVFNVLENGTNNGRVLSGSNIFLTETECGHELEKVQLLLTEREKEVGYLKEENQRLKEMLDWVKSKENGN